MSGRWIDGRKKKEEEEVKAAESAKPAEPVQKAEPEKIKLGDSGAAAQVAKSEGIVESGFRVVSNCGEDAQQTVKHLHLHVLGGKKMDGQMA